METQLVLTLASVLILLVTCAGLGVRLLYLARGRDEAPERWMGTGLIVIAAVAYPALSVSGLASGAIDDVRFVPLAIGLVGMLISAGTIAEFTRRVFRPQGAAAKAGVVALILFQAAGGAILFLKLAGAEPGQTVKEALGQLGTLVRYPLLVVWAWTGTEALVEWLHARKRLELGLTDVVVTNRFFLWGMFGVCQVLLGGISVSLQLMGRNPMSDPIAMGLTTASGLLTSTMIGLALCPPHAYVRWVETRHAAH